MSVLLNLNPKYFHFKVAYFLVNQFSLGSEQKLILSSDCRNSIEKPNNIDIQRK